MKKSINTRVPNRCLPHPHKAKNLVRGGEEPTHALPNSLPSCSPDLYCANKPLTP